ncbi:MAG: PilZ domain-containing protein [Gammaproteobacteria bacterium]|nr:PilZ domain-containing protein [Gammaproteobacteria bacterium]
MAYAYEKRDFERVKSKTAVSLFFGTPPKSLEGVCIDISDKGLGIDLESVIPIGTECRVKVHDGHKNSQPYQALIEIKNTQPLPKERCRVGALIIEMF